MYWLLLIIGGYLLGSIHFCRILGIIFKHTDIVKVSEDHNPGAANAFWYCGKPIGIVGLILDWLKGLIPVLFGILFLDYNHPLFILVMLAPVLGHAFSIINHFRGGKCITTIFGELSALLFTGVNPYLIFILGLGDLFFSYVKKILPGNKRALIFFSILILSSIIICIYMNQITILVGTVGVSLIAIFKHLPIYPDKPSKIRRKFKKKVANV